MSSFLTANAADPGAITGILDMNDERVQLPTFRFSRSGRLRPWEDGKLWPRPLLYGSNTTGALFGLDATAYGRWGEMPEEAGSQSMKKFTGTTRDSGGATLPQCLVQAFLTASDTFVGQVTSDNGGYYELPTWYSPDTHYLVAYKAGSPDVAGTTLNTLVAT